MRQIAFSLIEDLSYENIRHITYSGVNWYYWIDGRIIGRMDGGPKPICLRPALRTYCALICAL